MALTLNPALPAGTRGLWWFAQGLENLGEAATGPAVPTGSTYANGYVTHDATTDETILTTNQSLLIPANAVTMMLDVRHTDASARGAATLGAFAVGGVGLAGAMAPNGTTVYWDFAGLAAGTSRLTSPWAKDTVRHVWAFTAGSRGMEIWRDGVKVASQIAVPPAHTAEVVRFSLGIHGTATTSDLSEYRWVFIHETQLAETLIQQISADPVSMLTVEPETGASPHGGWQSRQRRRQLRPRWWRSVTVGR